MICIRNQSGRQVHSKQNDIAGAGVCFHVDICESCKFSCLAFSLGICLSPKAKQNEATQSTASLFDNCANFTITSIRLFCFFFLVSYFFFRSSFSKSVYCEHLFICKTINSRIDDKNECFTM